MKTKAVRLYGKKDLRLEEFELPALKDNEILASVVTDSICMSSWKLANQGADHKKTPDDLAAKPIVIGHEFCGEILEVGKKWQNKFKKGQRYVVQANLQLPDRPDCPGYSYSYTGGDATYIIIDKDVMEQDCLIIYQGETFFEGSLLEPLSCVIAAFSANYHLIEGSYDHKMGIKDGGNLLILGGTGPMGLLALDYALHGPVNPRHLVVTDINQDKLERAEKLYTSTEKTQLSFVNTKKLDNQADVLRKTVGRQGFDDIFVLVPSESLITMASNLLNPDGCLNFFAGPQSKDFSASVNFYDIHYAFTHYVGTSGGSVADMRRAVDAVEKKQVTAANIVTHVLGLNALAETTLSQPDIGGGKKLVYTHKNFNRLELAEVCQKDPDLARILDKTAGIWSKEAEDHVLSTYPDI
ncbi:L-sorbose 1-phosphate reductase [Streptococcus chenjunshii]|uniref:L-sorbose 1-phosphate reductase n=1 Tax=Streptococcus chenjunshii TaxID=2173853 RepID=A0A372KKA5_9STRE|nr:zinc-binding dehydrogenase [Streptococcus chenjunshii]AXQ77644.1 L-sorbose 1-phosphate reductase [Streptococcus chenjunshii]RFU50604.1 L-sorbose 1-phosphate reductase [Streptococcus chenjunshii]RFU52741.1 L-sorbose 1-phosphate reductase [Streptococcus chenjunshii]